MAATSTASKTKYRLFKVAAELNIGKETIVEFLHNKGFDISDKPTSSLSQEMYDVIMEKFEKEHKQIEKQRKKVDAYHERRVHRKKENEVDATRATPDNADVAEPVQAETTANEAVPIEEISEPVATEEHRDEPEVAREPVAEPVTAATEPEELIKELQPQAVEETPAASEPDSLEPVAATEPAVAEQPAKQAPEPEPVQEERAVVAAAAQSEPDIAEPAEAVTSPVVNETPVVPDKPARKKSASRKKEEEAPETDTEQAVAAGTNEYPVKRPKLQGLTVVGKISIQPEEDKDEKKKRRKRKRIRESKSIDIATTPGTTAKRKPTTITTTEAPKDDKKKKRVRGGRGAKVDQTEVDKAIRETRARMDDRTGSGRQKRSRSKRDAREERAEMERMEEEDRASILTVTEFVTVAELANLMHVDVGQVIGKCIGLGLMVSINQRLDKDTIHLVADEFGFTVEFQQDYTEDVLEDYDDPEETLTQRAPIVTIMGHVDHGKTSLLDYIRSANVVAGEAGGITQHIGAYSVEIADGRKITFLDTPGHEAFTAMRARGAQVTDIVILIVAADDSVMPQTVEAISHAQAAGVPIIVAINKVDKPDSNPERIRQQLADRGVLVEEWGGKYQSVEISAKQGTNIDKLLEKILLESEILDLKANADRSARGVIVEAEIDKGKGIIASALVQKGTLRVGDIFVAGQFFGRVRAMFDERGHRIHEAGPSEPAQILGLSGVPTAGDTFVSIKEEQEAKEIATRRQQLRREQDFKQTRRITLDDISQQIAIGGVQNLPLIIKGDVDGSVEALADALLRLSTPEVQVSVIMKSVGEISESDVLLAAASNAIIIGFHVRPNLKARKLAEKEGVDIRTYQIIYDTVNEIRAALEGMLTPEEKEEVTGTVEIRDVFKISRIGTIAGCYVLDGKITRNDKIRLLRDGLEVYTGGISSLRRIKDDVREVEQGFECGISLENMNDVKVGDIIEAFKMVEVKRKLEPHSAH